MYLKMLYVILLLLSPLFQVVNTTFNLNSKKMEAESLSPCPHNNQTEAPLRNFKYQRYNRTHKALSVDLTLLRPIDNEVGGGATLDRWGNGGWIPHPFLGYHANICDFAKSNKFFANHWKHFVNVFGIKGPEYCPIPAGNYSIKNLHLETDQYVPYFNGRYRLKVFFQRPETRRDVICAMAIVNINDDNSKN